MEIPQEASAKLKLFIFGATGRAGRETLLQSLQRGHQVTALTRKIEKGKKISDKCEWVSGNIYRKETLVELLKGHDVVISALGPDGIGKTTIFSDGLRNIVEACKEARVKRIVFLTAARCHPRSPWFYRKIIAPLFLKNIYGDMDKFDAWFEKNKEGITFCEVMPFEFTKKGLTMKYTVHPHFENIDPIWNWKTSIPDIGHFMMIEAEKNQYPNRRVDIGFQNGWEKSSKKISKKKNISVNCLKSNKYIFL